VNPEDIGKILAGAVPPLAAPPDRMARVRRRMVRTNTMRASASALAIAILLGGGVLGVQRLAGVGPPGGGPGGVAGSPVCPAALDQMSQQPGRPSGHTAISTPLRSVTLCRYQVGEDHLNEPPMPHLIAGPVQGDPAKFVAGIRLFQDDLDKGARPVPPVKSSTPEPAGSGGGSTTGSPTGSPAASDSPVPLAASDSPGSSPVPRRLPVTTTTPTNPACLFYLPTKMSVDVLYVVDRKGNTFRYLIERFGCAPPYAAMPSMVELVARIDQLLGSPY